MLYHWWLQPPSVRWWVLWALRKEDTHELTAIRTAATPYGESQGRSDWKKHGILVQKSWDAYQRNDFSEPRLLHFSINRKVLDPLTWDIWVHLISNNLLMLRLPALSCKISIQSDSFPFLFGAALSGPLEMLSPGLEILKLPTK